jgi:hypothetical protein
MDQLSQFQSLPRGRFYDLIVQLDVVEPGFLGWVTRLSESRRQVVYCVLARVGVEFLYLRNPRQVLRPPDNEQLLSLCPALQDMRQLRSSDLLQKYYGSCPDGFRGAVLKTREGPQAGGYYSRIHEVFANPEHRRIAKVIRQLRSVNLQQLNIVMALDVIFLWPGFIAKVSSVRQAEDLSTALELIRQVVGEEASNEALTSSIRSLGENTTVCEWVAGWLARAKHIPYAQLELGPDWVALNTGQMLTDAGLRFQNCLRNTDQIINVLKGRKFYFESSRHAVIAEVQSIGLKRYLIFAGVYTMKNGPVIRPLRLQIEKEFEAAGVPSLRTWPDDCPWHAVERIPNGFFDFDDLSNLDLQELEV